MKPTFHPTLVVNLGESAWPDVLTSSYAKRLYTRLHKITGSPSLSRNVVFIWARLHQLSSFLAAVPAMGTYILDKSLMSDKFDALERQTLELIHSEALGNSPHPAILTAFLNAVFIYMIQNLREVPRGSSICVTVASRIQSGLELVDIKPLISICPDILVWTILVGRSGAINGPVRYWFNEVVDELASMGFDLPEAIGNLTYFDVAQRALGREADASRGF